VFAGGSAPIEVVLNGWKRDVFQCLTQIQGKEFSLDDVYSFEARLRVRHPGNLHVRDKIRQQLQYLRDLGVVEFLGNGRYRRLW
jgi:type II restriction enzyme